MRVGRFFDLVYVMRPKLGKRVGTIDLLRASLLAVVDWIEVKLAKKS